MSSIPDQCGVRRASECSESCGVQLAFDTSTDAIAIALMQRDGAKVELRAARDFEARRAALSRLLPATRELLAAQGMAIGELTGIVVGRGPGSFTGVRIAVATAKGLAHGLGVPLYGLSTLDAVAWRLRDHQGLVGVVGDAMRGEVYPALFRAHEGRMERLAPDRVASPQEAAEEFARAGEPILLAGNGLVKYRGVFEASLGNRAVCSEESLWAPSGLGLTRAYRAALAAGEIGSGDPGTLLPVYTRLSDAEENERVRAGLPARPTPTTGVGGPGAGEAR